MKLSLLFPSWYQAFGSFSQAAKKVSTFPPLNLCIVAAIAEKAGWEVQIIDAHIEQLDSDELVKRVREFNPDLIGMTATTPFFNNVESVARLLKSELSLPIMIGGPHASICREAAFLDCFDYLFVGECDLNLSQFLEQFAAGEHTPEIAGIMMRKDGRLIYHGDSGRVISLDESPMPARHLLRNDLYMMGTSKGNMCYTSLQLSRGCPFSCVFCACDIYGKTVRMRSIENVMKELGLIVSRYGASHIYFVDDTLTFNRKYILSLCDEIQKSGLRFTFEGSTRANLWDEELVASLKKCGLIRISFGFETADADVRKIIKKEIPLDCYKEANRLNSRYGIETINSAMIGLPGETVGSIYKTFNYLADAREIHHVTLNIAMPYPGTELKNMADRGEYGLILLDNDFSKYQRYESAVMSVNGILPEELIRLQKKGLIMIYSKWWRWLPILKRFGFKTVMSTGIQSIFRLLYRSGKNSRP